MDWDVSNRGRASAVRQRAAVSLADLDLAVDGHGLQPQFQPIVALPDRSLVGYEALARWSHDRDLRPETVVARAVATGRHAEFERRCIRAAIDAALTAGLAPGSAVFINFEAATEFSGRDDDQLLARGAERLQLVFELTERSLLNDPPALLRKIAALRSDGFAIALDDVGADLNTLALLDVISPDVIKLDLALVQSQPRYRQARTWAAVLAHHERQGAVVLAEGIETDEHLQRAQALGATLGQGFLFGHPAALATDGPNPLGWTVRTQRPRADGASPFTAVTKTLPTRIERKDTVLALSRYLERQALDSTDPPMVLAGLQRVEFFSGATRRSYHELAAASPLVVVFGQDVAADLGSGVRGVALQDSDPLCAEWIVLTLGATTAAALIARECRDDAPVGADGDRRFEVALTNDRALVTTAARILLKRM